MPTRFPAPSACLVLLLAAAPARSTTIAWPTQETSPGNLNAAALQGPPSTFVTTFTHTTAATFSAFSEEVDYSEAALAGAFGLTLGVWRTVELVAFERNTNPIGFESSSWTFSDGLNTIVHSHDVGAGPGGALIKNENMTSAVFNALFGTSLGPSNTIGFLLFGLTQVPSEPAVDASNLDVTRIGKGVNATFNWPDVIALGVVPGVPEPGVAGMLLAGPVGLGVLGRRRPVRRDRRQLRWRHPGRDLGHLRRGPPSGPTPAPASRSAPASISSCRSRPPVEALSFSHGR